jgi:hypothetical protein
VAAIWGGSERRGALPRLVFPFQSQGGLLGLFPRALADAIVERMSIQMSSGGFSLRLSEVGPRGRLLRQRLVPNSKGRGALALLPFLFVPREESP